MKASRWPRKWDFWRPKCRIWPSGGSPLKSLKNRTGVDPLANGAPPQSERYGTPLGAALRVLSQESRDQTHDCGRESGRAAADTDRADDPVLPTRAVRDPDPGHGPDQRVEFSRPSSGARPRDPGGPRFWLRRAAGRRMIRFVAQRSENIRRRPSRRRRLRATWLAQRRPPAARSRPISTD